MSEIQIDQAVWAAMTSLKPKTEAQDHVFLTGDAGTGKTTLVKKLVAENAGKVIVLAPTGVAAVNAGGQTIHRFFNFPARPIGFDNVLTLDTSWTHKTSDNREQGIMVPSNPIHYEKYGVIKAARYLIIDEISMVRADLMDQIAWFFFKNFGDVPFGGLKLIMVGDLSQLPPVVASDDERAMIKARYASEFFFDAGCWKNIIEDTGLPYAQFKTVRLTKIHRQSDPAFIKVLNGIRNNSIAPFEITEFCAGRINREKLDPSDGIMLCSTNKIADDVNTAMINRLASDPIEITGTIEGDFNIKDCPVDHKLILKKGCRIMMMRNDPNELYHNGSIGEFIGYYKTQGLEFMEVKIDGQDRSINIEKYQFESVEFKFDKNEDSISAKATGTFRQFPVRVAYAITIHKSQGKTFDKIIVDTGRGAFAHGQLYVALSRCRTMEGIILRAPISNKDIIFNKRVVEFNRLNQ